MKEIELIEKRKLNEKHFLQEDGTIVAKVYSSNVHYLKDGKYEEIDNTLIKKEDYYTNKKNDYKVLFKEQGKDSLMRMEQENNYLDIKLKQSNDSKIRKQRSISSYMEEVSYDNILDGVDVEYQTLPTKVKETIILKNNQTKSLRFEVSTNLLLEIKNGAIIAKNQNNQVFTIEKPYMEDSIGSMNENITYELINQNGIYEILLKLDSDWLDSKDRVYPVYIDPTISDDKSANGVMDTYIYPGDTNVVRYNQAILKAGVDRVDGNDTINRTLIKFNLPTIGTGSEVIKATLTLCGYLSEEVKGMQDRKIIEIHRVTSPWTEETANWENMNDKYDARIDAVQFVNRSWIENGMIIPQYTNNPYGDITDLVKHWYKDTTNYGILIKSEKEVYTDSCYPAFYSKNHTITNANPEPVLTISYRNQNGLESYLDYQSQQFTDGNTLVNTYNGNLVGVFELASTIGSKLPAVLNLVYNTNDVILKNNGFKFNLIQTIREMTIENKKYYEYVDGDGTIHYFQDREHYTLKPGKTEPTIDDLLNPNYKEEDWYDKKVYCSDEDGLMLKLEKKDNQYIITDKSNNKMAFSKNNTTEEFYYLKSFEDVSNNKIQIIHNQNNQIIKVIDSSEDEITVDYSTNNLIKVTSPWTEATVGITENKVNSIMTLNGTTIFNYNEKNIISSITDTNNTKITYEYYNEIPYRIKKVTQYGLNNAVGKYLTFEYGFNETSIKDNKNRTSRILFNSSGNKISSNTVNEEEDITNAYSSYSRVGESKDDIYEKNRPLYENTMVRYVKNYLQNTSFETDDYYFQNTENVQTTFSTDCKVTGSRSLKVTSQGEESNISQEFNLEKGKSYTFSGYFKNDKPVKLHLFYFGDNGIVESLEEVESSDVFKRYNISIHYDTDASTNLALRILFEDGSTTYIDDIQLEDGEVVNGYNIVENSDFSKGLSDWILEPIDQTKENTYEIVSLNNNQSKALKIDLKNSKSVSKKIPIQGEAGDNYDISFWVKNEGIYSDDFFVVNCVDVIYEPVDESLEQYQITGSSFIPNKKWQFINYKSTAPFDYKSITIKFIHSNQVNQLYIANIDFYKDLNSVYYNYDRQGNLISTKDSDNSSNKFKYDGNNQLINQTDMKGKRFKYEYDKTVTDRVLNAITSTGIKNQIQYDSFGNPVSTKISKKSIYCLPENFGPIVGADLENIVPGTYKIRERGTEKYLKAEYNNVFLESDSCSNTLWDLEKVDNNYKIIYTMNPNYSLEYHGNDIFLNDTNSNNLFTLEENQNGSFYIKLANENKYLKAKDSSLEIDLLVLDDPLFEFYFETTDDNLFIESTATYSEDGKFVTSVTDSNLNTTTYHTNPVTGLTTSMTNAKNKTTNYTYNDKRQITSVVQGEKSVNYTYNNQDQLNKIIQGNKEYKFTYDDFLNLKTVNIGDNITLVNNEYEPNNGNLIKTIYGNNQENTYEYDEFDRVKKIERMDNTYQYLYNCNGNIAKVVSNNNIEKYDYDKLERVIGRKNGNFKIEYDYNRNSSITRRKYKLGEKQNLVNYILNESDNVLSVYLDNETITYGYDGLERLISKSINDQYNVRYGYDHIGNRTSNLIQSIQNGDNKYSYKYDKLNNITDIYYNNNLKNKYYYDEYNELIKEEDYIKNEKTEYTYDNSGNLLTKITKNLETGAIISTDTYEYQNDDWEDQLTKFNNQLVTYDAIGNPLSIGSNITLSWINGRSLSSYKDTSKNLNINYKYDRNGIRTEKEINGVTTKYHLENSSIIYEERGNNTIYYLYDLTGLLGFKYNNDTYYYIKNIQGDIIGILDQNYNEIVTYEYDSWGKLLSIKDNQGNEITDETNIGIINPFRYREYYYDTETGLYYLNNRYYNPTWGRFVNSDKLLGANANILSYNLYLYVSNNPINNCDPEGLGILKIIKAGVKAVVGVVKSVVNLVQSWNSKTPAEKKAFLTAPIPGIKGYKAAKSATSIGKNIYGNTIVEDDHNTANAYKHTLWNAIMTYEIGREFAKIYADAHEDGQTDMDATNMDLYNNAIGREIGDIYKYNENLAMQKSICPVPSRVHISCTGTQTFIFLGKEYTATAFSREAAYETMSQMVLEAIDQGMLVILIP